MDATPRSALAAVVGRVLTFAAIATRREHVAVVVESAVPLAVRTAVATISRLLSDSVHRPHLPSGFGLRSHRDSSIVAMLALAALPLANGRTGVPRSPGLCDVSPRLR